MTVEPLLTEFVSCFATPKSAEERKVGGGRGREKKKLESEDEFQMTLGSLALALLLTDFNLSVLRQKDVSAFNISVNFFSLMQEVEAFENSSTNRRNLGLRQTSIENCHQIRNRASSAKFHDDLVCLFVCSRGN